VESSNEETIALFIDLVSRDAADINLPAAALAIARLEYPNLRIDEYLEQLASMGDQAGRRVAAADPGEEITALNEFVFGDLGFSGNRDSYYDPRNSFLNEVLERRLGIPITLSLVYLEIAAGCGLTMEGVGFPGHFIVREVSGGDLIDPFNGGIVLDQSDCARLLAAQGVARAESVAQYVRNVSRRQMLVRMLNNLVRYYRDVSDEGRLEPFEQMLRALDESDAHGPPPMVQ